MELQQLVPLRDELKALSKEVDLRLCNNEDKLLFSAPLMLPHLTRLKTELSSTQSEVKRVRQEFKKVCQTLSRA